jgi:hypothetical protein
MDFYYGRPLGNELPGRSQVVSKELMDTVEWMMPSLLRIFAQRDVVVFDPVGPEDEQLASQESLYINHVFMKRNPGFMILYTYIKDALLQKVGYVKTFWDDAEEQKVYDYKNLHEDQVVQVVNDAAQYSEDVEVQGHDVNKDGTHDLKLRCKKKNGYACIVNVPPEEMIVDPHCKGDIKKARYVGQLVTKTRSEWVSDGFKKDDVWEWSSYNGGSDNIEQVQARDSVNEHWNPNNDEQPGDESTREITLLEHYLYLDYDGDKYAELRRLLLTGNSIVENEEVEEIPYDSWTPVPVPHRHIGLGMWDLVEDIQRIQTALMRQLLDNAYYTNNSRIAYDVNTVNQSDMMINRPGGHIRVAGSPAAAIMPIVTQPVVNRILPVIQYMGDVKETRTGTGRITAGVDADVLQNSTKGAYMEATGRANQRIEAIARIFAETGLASLFLTLHRLTLRYQDWPTQIKLRKDWITVNPVEWQDRADVSVNVGLGAGSREEIRNNLGMMAMAMEKAAAAGIVLPENVYNLGLRWQKELGFESMDFFTDPKSPEYQKAMQSKTGDPYVEAQKIKTQGALQEKQMSLPIEQNRAMADAQLKKQQMEQDFALGVAKLELDHNVDIGEQGIGAEIQVYEAQQKAATERIRATQTGGGSGASPE